MKAIMFHYECSCGRTLDVPKQATEGELFCPECGDVMRESVSEPVRPKQNYLGLLMLPLGLLAAFGTWYGVKAINVKQPEPPKVVQPQPRK